MSRFPARGRYLVTALVLGMSVLVVSCSTSVARTSTPTPTSVRIYAIDTVKPGEPVNLAALAGVMGGRVNPDGTACLWIGGEPFAKAIMWPEGFYATADPLVVRDASGSKRVAIGQGVQLSGFNLGTPTELPILGCAGIPFSGGGLFAEKLPSP
jgi:hypothetical protein